MFEPIDLDALIRSANDLEPLQHSASRLASLAAKESWSVPEVVSAISFDPVLTARVLKAANSAASGGVHRITTVREALVRLGMGRVVTIAVGSSVKGQMRGAVPEFGLSEGALWRHSVAASLAAESAVGVCKARVPHDAFTAALLHDMGKIVLARHLGPDHLDFLRCAREEGHVSGLQAEKELLGCHHGELAGLIAQHFNLPENIVIGVSYHHDPDVIAHVMADVVHLSDVVARTIGAGLDANPDAPGLSDGTVERLGLPPDGAQRLAETVKARLDEVLARYE